MGTNVFFPFQSKLNCEVLYDDLAYEVRWAVAGESIVVQLVSKLGKLVFSKFLLFDWLFITTDHEIYIDYQKL